MPTVADPQAKLQLVREIVQVDQTLVDAQPTLLGSIKLCISLGGFEADKEIYKALDIDAGHWSRITRAEAHFPVDKLTTLMDLCGNEAPLMWLNSKRGYDVSSMRRKETNMERRARLAEERAHAAEEALRAFVRASHGSQV